MSEPQTPGQVAYKAYCDTRDPWWHPDFAHLPPEAQHCWEVAAQAVLEAHASLVSQTPISDQLKAILALVGTIMHQGTQQDLDKLHLWVAAYAEVITARTQP